MNQDIKIPYLSIIVPIYNTEQYLGKCIESILAQTYCNYELILVDDGSTDNCPAICNRYAKQDSRIQVIHQKNKGVTSARKAGLAVSCGEYISFIDSDDWMEPDFYTVFMDDCQNTEPDIIVASGYQEEKVWDGTLQKQKMCMKLRQGIYHRREIKQILEKNKILPSLCLKLFKRELISENIQMIDNRVCMGEDMLCSYACMLGAETILIRNNYSYHYVRQREFCTYERREKNIKSVYYFAKNLKMIEHRKKAFFLDALWNRIIVEQLWYAIFCEFREQRFLLNKQELKDLKRRFGGVELSKLLSRSEYKMAVKNEKRDKRLIFLLYSLKCYQLLNIYMKIFKVKT